MIAVIFLILFGLYFGAGVGRNQKPATKPVQFQREIIIVTGKKTGNGKRTGSSKKTGSGKAAKGK